MTLPPFLSGKRIPIDRMGDDGHRDHLATCSIAIARNCLVIHNNNAARRTRISPKSTRAS